MSVHEDPADAARQRDGDSVSRLATVPEAPAPAPVPLSPEAANLLRLSRTAVRLKESKIVGDGVLVLIYERAA